MRSCEDYSLLLSFLFDEELDADDRKRVEDHLNQCAECREAFNQQRWFVSSVRKALPTEKASDSLRRRVEATCAEESDRVHPKSLRQPPIDAAVSTHNRPRSATVFAVAACAAMLLVTILLLNSSGIGLKSASITNDFAQTAADTHRRHLLGQLPLELESADSVTVSEWFDGKVPFRVMLPNYQHVIGKKILFELEGARLIGFNNDYAAYISYQMGTDPLSLLVTSGSVTAPSGGKTITARNIDFHYNNIAGLQVISWSHRGLTYALVSDFDTASSQQSCIVCHIGADDPDFQASFVL